MRTVGQMILIVLLLCEGIAGGISSAASWEVVLESSAKPHVFIAGFFDEMHGITGGEGEIYVTVDGGQTWQKGKNSSAELIGLELVDKKTAWLAGSQKHVRVTRDGGATWQAVTDFGEIAHARCLRFLSFLDPDTGWAAAPHKLGATSDGGQTWNEIPLPGEMEDIIAMALESTTHGYLLDASGHLFLTRDGGHTWTQKALGIPPDAISHRKVSPSVTMRFLDRDHGMVVLRRTQPEKAWIALLTTDGGDTWTEEPLPVESGGLLFAVPYLARDGKTLTFKHPSGEIQVLRRQ